MFDSATFLSWIDNFYYQADPEYWADPPGIPGGSAVLGALLAPPGQIKIQAIKILKSIEYS